MNQFLTETVSPSPESNIKLKERRESQDSEGLRRVVFVISQGGKKTEVSFRGREELPVLVENEKSKLNMVLGREPAHVSPRIYQEWKRRMRSRDGDGECTFLSITPDILGFYQLLLILSNDESLHKEIRQRISRIEAWQYTSDDWGIIDEILLDCLADADAYAGDAFIRGVLKIVNAKSPVERLRQFRTQNEESLSQEDCSRFRGVPVFHITSKYPTLFKGGAHLPDRFSGTHGEYIRNSFHTSLHRPVEGHLLNSWDDNPYILVSDLADVLEANGKPYAGYDQDTWWLRNPGEDFLFPHAWIIEPQVVPHDNCSALSVVDHRILIKKDHFIGSDIQQILQLESDLSFVPFIQERSLFSRIEMKVFDSDQYNIPRDERYYDFYRNVHLFFEYMQRGAFSFEMCKDYLDKFGISLTPQQFTVLESTIYLFLRDLASGYAMREIQKKASITDINELPTQLPKELLISQNKLGALHNAYPHADTIALTNAYDQNKREYRPIPFLADRIRSFDLKTRRCLIESGIFSTATNLNSGN